MMFPLLLVLAALIVFLGVPLLVGALQFWLDFFSKHD